MLGNRRKLAVAYIPMITHLLRWLSRAVWYLTYVCIYDYKYIYIWFTYIYILVHRSHIILLSINVYYNIYIKYIYIYIFTMVFHILLLPIWILSYPHVMVDLFPYGSRVSARTVTRSSRPPCLALGRRSCKRCVSAGFRSSVIGAMRNGRNCFNWLRWWTKRLKQITF